MRNEGRKGRKGNGEGWEVERNGERVTEEGKAGGRTPQFLRRRCAAVHILRHTNIIIYWLLRQASTVAVHLSHRIDHVP